MNIKPILGILPLSLLLASSATASALEGIKIKSDFRYRHELINKEGSTERQRQRMRARLGLTSPLDEQSHIGLQLASGSDDPVSANQTLDDASSTKSIGIDLAYLSYSFPDDFHLVAGKQKLPFNKPGKSELIWDGDLNPEGLSLSHTEGPLQLNLSSFWVDERSSAPDAMLVGLDANYSFDISENQSLTLFAGHYGYTHTKERATFVDATSSFGNSVNGSNQYANGFELIEFGLEYKFHLGSLPFAAHMDTVTNSAADKDNSGWLVGFSFGKVKKAGDWAIKYNHRRLEQDAVVGAFTDSDFIGGGTNGEGGELGIKIALTDKIHLAGTYFSNKIGLENSKDYERFQLDVAAKF